MNLAIALAAVSAVLSLIAIAWCFAVSGRLREISRVRGDLARLAAEGDLVRLASIVDSRLDALDGADERLRLQDSALSERLSSAVSHVGLVRFDALPGTAGMMSFSLALLDDRGGGFVQTAIYGRNDYRLYTKPIFGGSSEHPLTDEERAAIDQAMHDNAAMPAAERR